MRLPKALLALLLFSLLPSPALLAEPPLPTAKALVARMDAAAAKVLSFQADYKTTFQSGDFLRTDTGLIAMDRHPLAGSSVRRSLLSLKASTIDQFGRESLRVSKTVNDGFFLWTETRYENRPAVNVKKALAASADLKLPDPIDVSFFREALSKFGLKVVGRDKIGDKKMFLLEAAYPPNTHGHKQWERSKWQYWLGQDDLVVYRSIVTTQPPADETSIEKPAEKPPTTSKPFTPADALPNPAKSDAAKPVADKPVADKPAPTVVTTEYTNVKINPSLDPALFVYTPPDGALLNDLAKPR